MLVYVTAALILTVFSMLLSKHLFVKEIQPVFLAVTLELIRTWFSFVYKLNIFLVPFLHVRDQDFLIDSVLLNSLLDAPAMI